MGNRTAKFISALVGGIIAGAPLAAVSQNAPAATSTANAASDCLGSPKGTAPQGQHWHYRLERATKRQCWYLRAEGGKDSAKAVQTAQAGAETPPADSTASQQPSVQDARAEYLTSQTATAAKAPSAPAQATPPTQQVAPSGEGSAQQPAVATPWPDVATTAAAPAPQPAPAPVAAAAQPSTKPAKSPAPMALAAADAVSDKATGSLQMLLLVVGGALALAGVLASIVYRFAGGRVRVQTGGRVNWDSREPQDHNSRAPWVNATPSEAEHARPPRPVDFDAARPRPQVTHPQAAPAQPTQARAAPAQATQLAAFTNEIGRIAAQARSAHNEVADLDEADIFNGEFEIEPSASRLAASEAHDKAPAERDEETKIEDTVDVDVITAMLERLAQQGPRLKRPSLEADLADLARIQRGQSAARA